MNVLERLITTLWHKGVLTDAEAKPMLAHIHKQREQIQELNEQVRLLSHHGLDPKKLGVEER